MRSYARVEHAVFPRIAAVAETGWSCGRAARLRRLPGPPARAAAALPRARHRLRAHAVRGALRRPPRRGRGARHRRAGQRTGLPGHPLHPRRPRSRPAIAGLPAAAGADAPGAAEGGGVRRWPGAGAAQRAGAGPASTWTRSDETLQSCSNRLVLRLEDDGPAEGERAVYDVDIFDPCWRWKAAPLQGVTRVRVRAGRIPYYFRLAHDEPHRRFAPARSPHGEMDLHTGACDGPRLTSVPLPHGAGRGRIRRPRCRVPRAGGRRRSVHTLHRRHPAADVGAGSGHTTSAAGTIAAGSRGG